MAFKMRGWSPFTKSPMKNGNDKGTYAKKEGKTKDDIPPVVISSKIKEVDQDGNIIKTKISGGGKNFKEKITSADGTHYTKTKTKGGKTKTKEGMTIKGHISKFFPKKRSTEDFGNQEMNTDNVTSTVSKSVPIPDKKKNKD